MSARQLLEEVRRLSVEERIKLVGEIWESIGESSRPPISESQRTELRRRISYYEKHPEDRGVTLGEIMAKLGTRA